MTLRRLRLALPLGLALLTQAPTPVGALSCITSDFSLESIELIEPLPDDPADPSELTWALTAQLPYTLWPSTTRVNCSYYPEPSWLAGALCEAEFVRVAR